MQAAVRRWEVHGALRSLRLFDLRSLRILSAPVLRLRWRLRLQVRRGFAAEAEAIEQPSRLMRGAEACRGVQSVRCRGVRSGRV